jgi:hypothetical protein
MTLKPSTIDRLENLKPGERFRYYRGDPAHTKLNPETAAYSALLAEIFACAERLEAQGRIKCLNKEVGVMVPGFAGHLKMTDYIAIGEPAK